MASHVTTRGGRTRLPRLVYGTAWKKERTTDLVYQALQAGFRAIDTAAQPRHYREDLVAEGVRRALANGVVASRSELYLQTKFTPPDGQDLEGPNAPPYDPAAPIAEQVRSSVESSLRNFTFPRDGKDEKSYLDCLVLHSPLHHREDTVAVWTVLQTYVPDRIRTLGISNVFLEQLQEVIEVADEVAAATGTEADLLRPVVVQNRFHSRGNVPDPHNIALRQFCGRPDQRIVYQSFWTLTANPGLVSGRSSSATHAVAQAAGVSPEVAFYGLVSLGLGAGVESEVADDSSCPIVILDGTTSPEHMAADLAGIEQIAAWAQSGEGREPWAAAIAGLKKSIGKRA
ncbi:hypothetical protein SEUCBS139899_001595 [Sporothrix eucalyptigena]|uniref:NADP-dependent oxidoreductase domain-containing protein n=1 Tax=Sporothrix eucalyptigena TaxID=1812306 RepID=A0ABP0BN72_9PEZI